MDTLSIETIRPDLDSLNISDDLTISDLLGLPGSLQRLIGWILRAGALGCEQAADFLRTTEREARSFLYEVAAHGLIEHVPTCGIPVFRVCLVPRRLRTPPELLEMFEG